MIRAALVLLGIFLSLRIGQAADAGVPPGVEVHDDIGYRTGADLTPYQTEMCKLDLYVPAEKKGFPTIVWFHGGGLTGGTRKIDKVAAANFAKAGVAFASVEYELSPKVKYPVYLQDSAAAVAWVHTHIAEYGGDPAKLFIGGHSAGGYIALMLGMDAHYLHDAGIELSNIVGLIPVSGETVTHFTVRAERGIGHWNITANEAAPIFYCRKDTVPMLVLYADHDMPARAEENVYFVAVMKAAGNTGVTGLQIADRTHTSIDDKLRNEDDPARLAILNFVAAHAGK